MEAGDTRAGGSRPVLARLGRIAGWLAGVGLVLFVLDVIGVPVADWIRELFKQVRAGPAGAIFGGIALDSLQTVLAAVTWLTILRAASRRPGCRSVQCSRHMRSGWR